MKIHSFSIVACTAIALTSPSLSAEEVMEVEVNHPVTAAQYLVMPADPVTVNAMLGNGFPADLDYFTFTGQAGDVVTLDIDGAYAAPHYLDTVIAVFGAGPTFPLLRMNDDASPVDPGSSRAFDSRIDKFVLPQSGQYTVGVSNYPRYFQAGGGVGGGLAREGRYQLVISGVTPTVRHIAIDIKPGSTGTAPVNPKSRGKIPVALLSGPDFDPASVVVESLTFGAKGEEASLSKCTPSGEDLNADGTADLVCHFENLLAAFKAGDLEGVLRGRTADGQTIEGRGFLKVVPQKAPE